ncbi:MAG: FAD-dependent oxidoreductase [Deltaproteobacteria bacterium]|jgi:nitrite reductase (NADH) large subunit|nr:FAD-dependent oxidoreductase [Deltaproteobacteria bacterium]
MNIVIAGAGIAGLSAAETVRQLNPSANVIIFSQERQLPYFRPRLPELVCGAVTTDKLFVRPEEWFNSNNLELRKGERLVEICLDNRQARGSLGSRLIFDRLLIATGASSFLPDAAKNFNLPGIFPVRSLMDAWNLNYATRSAKTSLLMGSGLLGLEIGHALTKLGLSVHALERSNRILPFQTTPQSSQILQKALEAKGFVFHLESEAIKLEGQSHLERVLLSNGEALEVELLIVAAGVSPNLELANSLNLKVERGIVVDQYLETAIPGIYAAGDCAQTPDGKGGLWSIARQEGIVAGRNMALDDPLQRQAYVPIPPSSVLKVAGVDFIAAGNIDPEGKLPYAEYATESTYRKAVVNQLGVLTGFTNVGATVGNRELGAALNRQVAIPADVLAALGQPDFDFETLKGLSPPAA